MRVGLKVGFSTWDQVIVTLGDSWIAVGMANSRYSVLETILAIFAILGGNIAGTLSSGWAVLLLGVGVNATLLMGCAITTRGSLASAIALASSLGRENRFMPGVNPIANAPGSLWAR